MTALAVLWHLTFKMSLGLI